MLTERQVKSLKEGQKLMLKRGVDYSYLRADVVVISTKNLEDGYILVRIEKVYAHGGHVDLHRGNVIRVFLKELSL